MDLWKTVEEKQQIAAYYQELLADSSTSAFMQEVARRNLSALEGETYSIDWQRIDVRPDDRPVKAQPSEPVVNEPEVPEPEVPEKKLTLREQLFGKIADIVHEGREQKQSLQEHNGNELMNEAGPDEIPF